MKTKLTFIALLLFLVTGCQLNNKKVENSSWYLRSEITWWEARPEFRLKVNPEKTLLQTEFSMVTDGQEYHLKITDKVLSKDKNCGAPSPAKKLLPLDIWMPLSCEFNGDELVPLSQGYHFYPTKAEKYLLQVRLENGEPVALKVSETK